MTTYLSNRQSAAQLYALDELEFDSAKLLHKNRVVLWKIFELYCPHSSQIPQLTSDPHSAVLRRSKPIVSADSVLVLFRDWDVTPSLIARSLISDRLDAIVNASGIDKISFDQFCDLLLAIAMEVALEHSDRFICFFDDEKAYRQMMTYVITNTPPVDYPPTVAGLRILFTVMDRSHGRRKFNKSRALTVIPPFICVEGASTGAFETFTAGHKSHNPSDDLERGSDAFPIKDMNEKTLAALRENESILISMALRYSVARGLVATGGRFTPRRLSYYSLVEDAAVHQSKKQSVLIPFDALWRLMNDFGVCPEVVSKEHLREIVGLVMSDSIHEELIPKERANSKDCALSEKDDKEGVENDDEELVHLEKLQQLPDDEVRADTDEEVIGLSYDQFEVVLGAIAESGYRLGGPRVPVEKKMRVLFSTMNHSPGRSRLILADRTAPVIPPLYDEERMSFREYVRATSPVRGRAAVREAPKFAVGIATTGRSQSAPSRFSTPCRGDAKRRSISPTQQRRHDSPPMRHRSSDTCRQKNTTQTPGVNRSDVCNTGRSTRHSSSLVKNERGVQSPQDAVNTPEKKATQGYTPSKQRMANTPEVSSIPTTPDTLARTSNSTRELLEFQLDERKPLLVELQRLGVLERPSKREERLNRDGKWCVVTCQKLDVLQQCLQNNGTEEEWKEVFHHNDFILVEYLLSFMNKRVNRILMDGASRCLAYAHLVYEPLWLEFVTLAHRDSVGVVSWHMVRIAQSTSLRVSHITSLPSDHFPDDGRETSCSTSKMDKIRKHLDSARQRLADENGTSLAKRNNSSPAVGTGRDPSSSPGGASTSAVTPGVFKRNKFLTTRMETSVICAEAVAIWILVLTNVYQVHSCRAEHMIYFQPKDGVNFVDKRATQVRDDVANGGSNGGSNGVLHSDGKFISNGVLSEKDLKEGQKRQLTVLAKAARDMVICTRHCPDLESMVSIIKGVAMINYHLPRRSEVEDEYGFLLGVGEDGSDGTEVSKMIVTVQFSEKNISNGNGNGVVNLCEGILNGLNDMSYPGNNTPELNPLLKLCCDLLNEKSHEGYFYKNDKKVLVDIAVRELHNIPVDADSTETRYRYLEVIHDTVSFLENDYRNDEIASIVEFITHPECSDDGSDTSQNRTTSSRLEAENDSFDMRALANAIAEQIADAQQTKRKAARLTAEEDEREAEAVRLVAEEAEKEAVRLALEEDERERARLAAEEAPGTEMEAESSVLVLQEPQPDEYVNGLDSGPVEHPAQSS